MTIEDTGAHYPRMIISGGQTGVDRGGLIAAALLGYDHGGWCPKGRMAEDGRIPDCYPVTEASEEGYAYRTRLNVEMASATIVITYEEVPTGGSALTLKAVQQNKKPAFHMVLDRDADKELDRKAAKRVRAWLAKVKPDMVNVAGPRESKAPGIKDHVAQVLLMAFQKPSGCICGRVIPDAIWEPESTARTPGTPVRCSGCKHVTYWTDFVVTPDSDEAPAPF